MIRKTRTGLENERVIAIKNFDIPRSIIIFAPRATRIHIRHSYAKRHNYIYSAITSLIL